LKTKDKDKIDKRYINVTADYTRIPPLTAIGIMFRGMSQRSMNHVLSIVLSYINLH